MDIGVPAAATEAPLLVKKKRPASDAGSEASRALHKKSRKDASDVSASDFKRKRSREAPQVTSQEQLEVARKRRAKEMRDFKKKYETSDFVMTPEDAREAQKQIEKMLAERKIEQATIEAARDEKLQSIGIDASDDYFLEKLAEVRQLAGSVQKQVVEEAAELLEQIPEASVAVTSVVASESASIASVLEAPVQVTQTSNLPLIIPSPVSPSNDSDIDDVPIGQRMRKMSKPSPQPQQTTPQLPLQAEQSSAAAECTEDPEDPPTSDLPQCDSPSNLFSLERHLGGEITKTPEKATKSVPQKIELVNQSEPVAETAVPESVQVIDSEQTITVTESKPNQQQPEQPHQPSPNQTTISTPTSNQPENQHSPQKANLEPVVETVVSESAQVTESDQTVAITVSEPIQTTTHPSSITITNDQASSSSSTIQTLQPPPPPNMLKSEFLDAELLAITFEVQRLVEQRRSPTLHLVYQE